MHVAPLVRYLLLSQDFVVDPDDPRQISIVNLLASYNVLEDYPTLIEEICCVAAVSGGRGSGQVQVVCVDEESERGLFAGQVHEVHCGEDPLDLMIVPFRIRDCYFPKPGMYSFQLFWNGELIGTCSLRLR